MISALSPRCAIYTRKSSDEGLDQEFNSLDAQRESCEAFIKSQAGEGWQLLDSVYDDGGYSGGTMERPALNDLLRDIQAGMIDVVVVYKVDRLTRSLTDFARIVDIFESHSVSFVSVTQAFNTTTSMGRLTLNVLLSFAQFEREVTGERIRDKIAASKKKGMWMGGNPPLGYDVIDRKLAINTEEAKQVRAIFERYLELESVTLLAQDLKLRDIRSKSWRSLKGIKRGGGIFSRGALYALLKNRIYLGKITHRGEIYDGEHEAILPQRLWEQVQEMLSSHRRKRIGVNITASKSVLSGLLFDDRGNPMSPAHAKKQNGKRYRYYVSQALIKGQPEGAGTISRVPAQPIEELVAMRAKEITGTDPWDRLSPGEQANKIRTTIQRAEIHSGKVKIKLNKGIGNEEDRSTIQIPFQLKKRGGEKVILTPDGSRSFSKPRPDRALIKAVTRAFSWQEALDSGEAKSIADLAKKENCTEPYIRRLIGLGFLAPEIIEAILQGTQPPYLNLGHLLEIDLPLSWSVQRKKLGI